VGTRAAVGSDTAAEKAVEGAVGSVLGSLIGGRSSSRSSDRPDTVRDPTRKIDFVERRALNGGLETGARSMWTEGGLLVSMRIEDAPGKGTFQAVLIQSCDGRRYYPIRLEIYKLWPERSVSVGWSRTSAVNGEVVQSDSGRVSEAWGDSVDSTGIGSGPAIWQQLGFERAHHGARQLGAYFDIDPAEFARLDEAALFVHTTLPEREPVTTLASSWLIGQAKDGEVSVAQPRGDPGAWWDACRPPSSALRTTLAPAITVSQTSPGDGLEVFWQEVQLTGLAAKVIAAQRPLDTPNGVK
jgi:hypothetical protein